jgi:single-strand DNA-binding protein
MFINSITLQGNVGKDAETRYTEKGLAVTTLTLATSHGDITEWHRIVAFDQIADEMRAIKKGQFLQVTGELRSRKYTDQAGVDRTVWNVQAKAFEVKQRPARRNPAEPAETEPAQAATEEVPL